MEARATAMCANTDLVGIELAVSDKLKVFARVAHC